MRPTPHRLNLAAVAAVHTGLRVWTFLASDNGIDFHHNAYDRGLFVTRWLAHFTPVPEPGEVANVFEVPLAFLMDPANHQRHSRELRGIQRSFYAMPHGPHYIWGVTAGIIRNLYERTHR